MEGFKSNPKMKSQLPCFKEGGYVTKKELVAYEKKEDRAEEKKDLAEDKKIAKKAIAQHESAQHKGSEKTEIKLKAGRRVKKEGGVVNKFKKGGAVDAAEKGKPSGDKDVIKKVAAKPKKAAAPSKAKTKKPEVPGSEVGMSGDMDSMMMSEEEIPGYFSGGFIKDIGPAIKTASKAIQSQVPQMVQQNPQSPLNFSFKNPDLGGPISAVARKINFGGQFADGGWVNEEPDDMTAIPGGVATTMANPMVGGAMGRRDKAAKLAAKQQMQAQRMAQRQARQAARPQRRAERSKMMDMFQGGPGAAMPVNPGMDMPVNPGMDMSESQAPMGVGQFADGGPTSFGGAFGARQPVGDGMGQASPSGAMGNAAAMGAPSDQERNIMRGLAAIGSFCYGGKVK